jgi:hypothetical protein
LNQTRSASATPNESPLQRRGISRSALKGASFTSPQQVRDQIDAFVKSYNARAKPFSWTAATVHQKHLGTRVSHP